MLKSSIIQFRNDVHKQAKRIMQSHDYTAMRASSTAAFLTASTTSARSYIRPPTGGLGTHDSIATAKNERTYQEPRNSGQN